MKNLSIFWRFAIATVALLTTIVVTIVLVANGRMEETLRETERQQLSHYHEMLMGRLSAEGNRAHSMALLVASIPEVQQAFAAGDREALAQMFGPGFGELKQQLAVRQFQFHTPPATSFLRVHKLKKFGDDLSSFRKTVVETNNSKAPVSGLEVGVAGLGIRGIVPVFNAGEHIGSVEFGMSFGQAFFDEFKKQYGVDVALHLDRDGSFKTLGSTLKSKTLLQKAQMQTAMKGKVEYLQAQSDEMPVGILAESVTDYSGNPIGVVEIVADRSFFSDAITSMQASLLGLGLLGLLIGIFSSALIARGITAPLKRVANSFEEIADGDGNLNVHLAEEGSDETVRLGRAFNRFIERIRETVEEVAFAATRLAPAVESFSSGAESTHRGMLLQQRETEQIAAAVNEMSATVHEVASNTSLAADAANQADHETDTGKQVVGNTIKAISDVSAEMERISEVIANVNDDSQRIGGVLDVIVGIAEQTNLLALNAAIEAARAGEQGRGFAVVADEVRSLAQRTQRSTEEIRTMIEGLQSSTKQAVGVIAEGRKSTEVSVQQAGQAGESLDAILSAVDTINAMNTQIATAAEEQSAVAEEINRNISRISDVTAQTTSEAAELSHESETLVKLSEELLGVVGSFNLGEKQLMIDLEKAKVAHLAWKVKLRGFLDGRAALTREQAVSDHDCAFGKWYFGKGVEEFGHINEMKDVRTPHAEMHSLIHKIIDLKEKGNIEAAEQEYEKVAPLSEQIVGLIDAIKQHVSEEMNIAS
jgi:methyl-accepting chemotaxis protein